MDKETQAKCDEYVEACDPWGLRAYLNANEQIALEAKSYKVLRDLASGFGVPYYSRMNKSELIESIREALDARSG